MFVLNSSTSGILLQLLIVWCDLSFVNSSHDSFLSILSKLNLYSQYAVFILSGTPGLHLYIYCWHRGSTSLMEEDGWQHYTTEKMHCIGLHCPHNRAKLEFEFG